MLLPQENKCTQYYMYSVQYISHSYIYQVIEYEYFLTYNDIIWVRSLFHWSHKEGREIPVHLRLLLLLLLFD